MFTTCTSHHDSSHVDSWQANQPVSFLLEPSRTSLYRNQKKKATDRNARLATKKRGHLLERTPPHAVHLTVQIPCIYVPTIARVQRICGTQPPCRALASPTGKRLWTRIRSNIPCSNNQMDHTRIDFVPPTAQRLIKTKASILATDWEFGCAINVQSE